MYDERLRSVGLRSTQLTVLVAVGAGIDRPVEIAARLDMEKSTVTRTLQVLESNGWIERTTRGRAQEVELTNAGGDMLAAALEPWRAATDEIERRLNTDTVVPWLDEARSPEAREDLG